jgi:hypothetical protein
MLLYAKQEVTCSLQYPLLEAVTPDHPILVSQTDSRDDLVHPWQSQMLSLARTAPPTLPEAFQVGEHVSFR